MFTSPLDIHRGFAGAKWKRIADYWLTNSQRGRLAPAREFVLGSKAVETKLAGKYRNEQVNG